MIIDCCCVCGCGAWQRLDLHHAVTQQTLRRADPGRAAVLCADPRNLVPVSRPCHAAHHARTKPILLAVLPNRVFNFACEILGAGPAYEYLHRHYDGQDPRLDALLQVYEDAA